MLEFPDLTSKGIFRMLEVAHETLEPLKPVTGRKHKDEAQHWKYYQHEYYEQDQTFHAYLRTMIRPSIGPIVQRVPSFCIGLLRV